MIKKFIEIWDEHKGEVEAKFRQSFPGSYLELVKAVIEVLHAHLKHDDFATPDPERISVIDWGDYQGTQVFVIGETGYQPLTHYITSNYYGSCSGCDTLQSIDADRIFEHIDQNRIYDELMTLALHILQRMKSINAME